METNQLIIFMLLMFIIYNEVEKKKRTIIHGNENIKSVLEQNIGKNCLISYNVNGLTSTIYKRKCKGEVINVSGKAVEVSIKNKKGIKTEIRTESRTEILNLSYISNIRAL